MTASNYRNDTLLLGFSNLRQLRGERPLVIAGGKGIFVFDENGKDYVEAVSSFYCTALGFSEDELIEAAIKQFRMLPFYASGLHRTVPVVMELADRLAAIAPIPRAKIAFAVTGSEANDNLMKFTWYRNVFRGEPKRRKMISRQGSYHGSSIATTALGGAKELHDSFAIPMADSLLVSQPDHRRLGREGEDESAFVARLCDELDAVIQAAGPDTVAAFIAEPLSVSAGMIPPPEGYFAGVKAVLDRYGIALYVDEVVTGFGRTGEFWGSTAFGLAPDALTTAKGLSSAYQPISAIVMSEAFYEGLERGSDAQGWFAHAGTYHAHPVAAAVALKTIEIIERRDIIGHVRRMMPLFRQALESLRDHPLVSAVRCFGLAGAIDAVDPTARGRETTAAPRMKHGGIGKAIYEAGLEHGVILRPLADGVVLAPPLIITAAEITELTRRIRAALDTALGRGR
jgi:4-aminobutyrate--pyruvate transaminase